MSVPTYAQLYASLNADVLRMVPPFSRRILDLGCGVGTFGHALKTRQPCEVVGVTYNSDEAKLADLKLNRVVVADLNDYDPAALGEFDCVVCSHVLEHLNHPEDVLGRISPCLTPDGQLLVALPNVLFWRQRLVFLGGRFRYSEKGGLMDSTHYRFFDWQTAQELIVTSGYDVSEAISDGYLPFSWLFPPFREQLNRLAIQFYPGLFGIQFRFRCVPRRITSAHARA